MRIKTLMTYNLSTTSRAILIFFCCYTAGQSFGTLIAIIATRAQDMDIAANSSFVIFSYVIFMLVANLITAQKETRFLITRSVSRKEIFLSSVVFNLLLCALMAALAIVSVHIDGAIRWCFGLEFRGLSIDLIAHLAPDLTRLPVYYATVFALLLGFGAFGYLAGSFTARWKIQTIGISIILALVFFGCLIVPGFLPKALELIKFFFTDVNTGLLIALKHLVLSGVLFMLSFPVMRRVIAAKKQ